MKYRSLGASGIKVPALGYGCMRLPMLSGRKNSKRRCAVDIPEAVRMMHYAYEHGVSYFDSAYGYHMGWSESVLGKALAGLPRDKVMVTTKLPVWLAKRPADFRRLLSTQLRRLRTDYLDFYFLHALNAKSFERVRQLGVLDFIDKAVREGRIRRAGFSFHDGPTAFKPIVDAYDWTTCQIQYNVVDTHHQAGLTGLRYAAKRGLGVIAMEPLRGGDLAGRIAPSIKALWDSSPIKRTSAEWALRWLWHQPEVSIVLSGMSTMEQVKDNIRYASRSGIGLLSEDELALVKQVQRAYRKLRGIPCTACGYCMPCPSGVAIPRNFSLYNDWCMFPGSDQARLEYRTWMDAANRASACKQCGQCVAKCPQQLAIPELLKKAHSALS
ncbi:aldo/keto reductase [candidate division WOR-3 bacterium]|uniref:Aldo/keto reductase n=1 Tax=candidate division WOR-3 bacterium TaxID=2052148 RepID=A0A937XC30_UNCW3|nr:aldo/keto reductase [candidate division WOR-3 bacterium]